MTSDAEQRRLYEQHATRLKEGAVLGATGAGLIGGAVLGASGHGLSRSVNAARGARYALKTGTRVAGKRGAFDRAKQGAKWGRHAPNHRFERANRALGPIPAIAGSGLAALGAGTAADRLVYPNHRRSEHGFVPREKKVKKNMMVSKAFASKGVANGLKLAAGAPKPTRVAPQKFSAPTPRLRPLTPKPPTVAKAFVPILSAQARNMRIGQVANGARKGFGGRASQQFPGHLNMTMHRQGQQQAAAARMGSQAMGGSQVPRGAGAAAQQAASRLRPQAPGGVGRGGFNMSQGGGAVPRGAGASAHMDAHNLRGATPRGPATRSAGAGRPQGPYRKMFGRSTGGAHRGTTPNQQAYANGRAAGQAARQKTNAFVGQHKTALGVGAGAVGVGGAGAAYGVHRKNNVQKSVWGVEHTVVSKKTDEYGYNHNKSFKGQGIGYKDNDARWRVANEAGRNAGLFSPRATHKKENWKTMGAYGGGGSAAGAAAGAGIAAAMHKNPAHGAAYGAAGGWIAGGNVADYKISSRANRRAVHAGIKRGDIKTGLKKDQITAFGRARDN